MIILLPHHQMKTISARDYVLAQPTDKCASFYRREGRLAVF